MGIFKNLTSLVSSTVDSVAHNFMHRRNVIQDSYEKSSGALYNASRNLSGCLSFPGVAEVEETTAKVYDNDSGSYEKHFVRVKINWSNVPDANREKIVRNLKELTGLSYEESNASALVLASPSIVSNFNSLNSTSSFVVLYTNKSAPSRLADIEKITKFHASEIRHLLRGIDALPTKEPQPQYHNTATAEDLKTLSQKLDQAPKVFKGLLEAEPQADQKSAGR